MDLLAHPVQDPCLRLEAIKMRMMGGEWLRADEGLVLEGHQGKVHPHHLHALQPRSRQRNNVKMTPRKQRSSKRKRMLNGSVSLPLRDINAN